MSNSFDICPRDGGDDISRPYEVVQMFSHAAVAFIQVLLTIYLYYADSRNKMQLEMFRETDTFAGNIILPSYYLFIKAYVLYNVIFGCLSIPFHENIVVIGIEFAGSIFFSLSLLLFLVQNGAGKQDFIRAIQVSLGVGIICYFVPIALYFEVSTFYFHLSKMIIYICLSILYGYFAYHSESFRPSVRAFAIFHSVTNLLDAVIVMLSYYENGELLCIGLPYDFIIEGSLTPFIYFTSLLTESKVIIDIMIE